MPTAPAPRSYGQVPDSQGNGFSYAILPKCTPIFNVPSAKKVEKKHKTRWAVTTSILLGNSMEKKYKTRWENCSGRKNNCEANFKKSDFSKHGQSKQTCGLDFQPEFFMSFLSKVH